MHWLQTVDTELFRFINLSLINPVFDVVMPFVSDNRLFRPALLILAAWLIWKHRGRGLLFVGMLAIVVGLGDGLVINPLKHLIARDRPFLTIPDVHCLLGKGGSGSMPSGHAANWGAATMVVLFYYRRALWFVLPLAVLVGFSRIYNGVHYPSDVLAGAILGAGYAVAFLWCFNAAWRWAGQKWFPLWWKLVPSLIVPPRTTKPSGTSTSSEPRDEEEEPLPEEPSQPLPATRGLAPQGFRAPHVTIDDHWVRLGYVLVAVLLLARWLYLASGTIQLSEDEAYQWVWSKHLALSYYSKPPLIAYTQFLGTSLWGDTALGVRFFSPLLGAALSIVMLRFFAREVNARAGFILLLVVTTTPLLAVGSLLMTIDPLSVFFWSLGMFAGWRAVQEKGTIGDWSWVGLWMGLGFLSKYTELFQLLCWAVFFALWAPARRHLRRPGPYVALLINLVCAVPVLIWNSQHDWITVKHVSDTAGMNEAWHPTLKNLFEFLGAELGLLNPVFFVATMWASVVFWRRHRRNPLLVYFFSMGAPLFLAYLLYSFRSRVLPNWIAPSVLPLFCLMVTYWDTRWRLGVTKVKRWLMTGLVFGAMVVGVFHNTNIVGKLTGYDLPVNLDPLYRVREWDTTARIVGQARETLLAEGKPVFIIANHYGMTGELSFYLPEARTNVLDNPLVYCRSADHPENQFYFFPGYSPRKGDNAIYVRELNRSDPKVHPPPPRLLSEFESVSILGVSNVFYRDKFLLRPMVFYACRGLK
jgi:4-amino-4-deoxy-L-arabinose transferase-like glycosyltransferase/membrane-associated phospholipid phosphatase